MIYTITGDNFELSDVSVFFRARIATTAGYVTNAITALGTGLGTVGSPASNPTAYFQVTSLDDRGNIVTGFPSWKGLISAASNFGAAFGSELGNRVHFGLHILGNGTQFSLSNLKFQMH
jgi:hypothetical protein